MVKKINNFAYFKDNEVGARLTFTYSIYDENGSLFRNNIRESIGIKDDETEILEAIKNIKDYIEKDINE